MFKIPGTWWNHLAHWHRAGVWKYLQLFYSSISFYSPAQSGEKGDIRWDVEFIWSPRRVKDFSRAPKRCHAAPAINSFVVSQHGNPLIWEYASNQSILRLGKEKNSATRKRCGLRNLAVNVYCLRAAAFHMAALLFGKSSLVNLSTFIFMFCNLIQEEGCARVI